MAQRFRAYHAPLPQSAGETVQLDAAESHHVARVLRRRTGERIDVFDGAGREWACAIESGGPRGLVVRLVEEVTHPVETGLPVVLFQACRPERLDWVVQKATELGVAEIRPIGMGTAGGAVDRLVRLGRIAVEASKQCGRRTLPRLSPIPGLPPAPSGVLALLLDERPDAPPIGDALAGPPPAAVWLGVGPEAGFGEEIVERAVGEGWLRAGLGPRTLRTETAGIVAAAIVLHRLGDLGRSG